MKIIKIISVLVVSSIILCSTSCGLNPIYNNSVKQQMLDYLHKKYNQDFEIIKYYPQPLIDGPSYDRAIACLKADKSRHFTIITGDKDSKFRDGYVFNLVEKNFDNYIQTLAEGLNMKVKVKTQVTETLDVTYLNYDKNKTYDYNTLNATDKERGITMDTYMYIDVKEPINPAEHVDAIAKLLKNLKDNNIDCDVCFMLINDTQFDDFNLDTFTNHSFDNKKLIQGREYFSREYVRDIKDTENLASNILTNMTKNYQNNNE